MRRWEDAMFELTAHTRWMDTPPGRSYYEKFEASFRHKDYEGDRFDELPEGFIWMVTRQTLAQAEPVWVSHDICQLVDHARDSMQPEVVLPTDLFAPVGFALLAESLHWRDRHAEDFGIKAMSWMPIRFSETQHMGSGGVWVSMFTADEDDASREFRKSNPLARLTLIHSFAVEYNTRGWDWLDDDDEGAQRLAGLGREQWTMVQTLWRIGAQVARVPLKAPRQARRERARLGLENRENVTVVRLRKVEYLVSRKEEEEGSGRHLTKRHLVRGHWRNQPYGPQEAKVHRQIWIAPYVKGPEDGELKLTDRVFELTR